MKRIFVQLVMLGFFVLVGTTAYSQTGSVKGKVLQGADSAAIWGASVYIENTSFTAYTEEDGSFVMENMPTGSYDISCTDYVTGDTAFMPGVKVTAGQVTEVTITVGKGKKKTVVVPVVEIVYDKPEAKTEAANVAEIKNSGQVTTGMSEEEMKQGGLSTVTAAAKQATGVTVEGGKYVYVRGLSDRYSKTVLDGSEIPGLDANRNAVQLDMFPTSFVQSIKIIKSFTPDLPGDFAGGLVDIRTKDFSEKLEWNFSLGGTFNPQANFNKSFLSSTKSKTDWLGFDNGYRDVPSNLQSVLGTNSVGSVTAIQAQNDDSKAQLVDDFTKGFNNELEPSKTTSGLNHKFGVTVSNTKTWFKHKDTNHVQDKRKFQYFAGLSYRRNYSFYDNATLSSYTLSETVDNASTLVFRTTFDETYQQSKDVVLMSGLARVAYVPNSKTKYKLSFLRNHSGTSSHNYGEGLVDDDETIIVRTRQMSYVERAMNSFQLSGNHLIDTLFLIKKKAEFDWKTSFTLSSQNQPDFISYTDNARVSGTDTTYEFLPATYLTPSRFFRDMSEINSDTKLDLKFPFESKKMVDRTNMFKFGYSQVYKSRDFNESRVEYQNLTNVPYDGTSTNFFNEGNLGWTGTTGGSNDIGVFLSDFTELSSSYTGLMTVLGGYGMYSGALSKKLEFIGGVRVEKTFIQVESDNPFKPIGEIDVMDVLPSFNLVYNLKRNVELKEHQTADTSDVRELSMKIRLSANRTLARPNFREIAPFANEDGRTREVLVGNPLLERATIDNYDIRWELYPREGEQISIAGFYKQFTNPIEQVINPAAANIEKTWINAEKGNLYGVEVEFRKKLTFISPKLKNFGFNTNLTLVKSQIQIREDNYDRILDLDPYHKETRPMFGQSPYIINAVLSYNNDSLWNGINANLNFNVFGERIVLVTDGGTPDVFEQPRPSLNLNFSKNIGDRLKVSLRAKNILNPKYQFVYKFLGNNEAYNDINEAQYLRSSYKIGRSFSVSLSYKLQPAKKKKKGTADKAADTTVEEKTK